MCDMRTMSLISLGFGLISVGALSLAVATDYWLFTQEPLYMDYPGMEMNTTEPQMFLVKIHSGLWRACTYYDDLPGKVIVVKNLYLCCDF